MIETEYNKNTDISLFKQHIFRIFSYIFAYFIQIIY